MKLFSPRGWINVLLLTSVLLIGVCGMTTIKRSQQLESSINWVLHTHDVLEASNQALLAIVNAESKVSYYVITNDEKLVKDIPQLLATAEQHVLQMYQLTKDNPLQTPRVIQLQALLEEKISRIKSVIDEEKRGKVNHLINFAKTENRLELRNRIAELVSEINEEERILLSIRNKTAFFNLKNSNTLYLLFSLFSGAVIIISLVLLNYNLYQRNLDLNRRKKIEEELRKSERYTTAILESASDCILVVNQEKKILSVNPKTISEFNYSEKQLLEFKIDDLIGDIDMEKASLSYAAGMEVICQCNEGVSFPAEIKLSRMSSDDRQQIFVIMLRNTTDRKNVERVKNEFISVVSHELRTPITSIIGALGLILGGTVGECSEKVKRLLNLAHNNSKRLLLLINDILDIEKIEAGKMKFDCVPINIETLIDEAVLANAFFADKYNVSINFNNKNKALYVLADGDRLMQVLTNLISNAVKFSTKKEEVSINVCKQENKVRVSVLNKGKGIPEEFHAHIFQKFSQADTSNTRDIGGTGLGLNISKAIIEKLGGTLNFTSKLNETTVFYFDLPLTQVEQEKIEIKSPQRKHNRILICEDDETQASYICKLLESSGFDVDVSYTASEAKQFLKKKQYHVLLLDLILPDQDGIAFIREIREDAELQSLSIIVLSVIASTGRSLLHGEALKVMDWFEKPLNFKELLKSIKSIKNLKDRILPQVLHVEADPVTLTTIKKLTKNIAVITSAKSLEDAQQAINNAHFDLIILDLMAADGNADQLLSLFAEHNTPVVIYSMKEFNKSDSPGVKEAFIKSKSGEENLIKMIMHILSEEK